MQKTYYEMQLEKITAEACLPGYLYIQVRQSRDFMNTCYAEKIELGDMAAAACMSRFHYIRIFRQVYGITPRHYLKDLRIHKAKELIRNNVPVTEVCAAVGYDSMPTFSTSFKKGTGLSPKEFQRVNKSNRE